jgi:endonuclease/exonuclease/phosphatase family metal-dependent hydrolase
MGRATIVLACGAALLLGACTGGDDEPEVEGPTSVRVMQFNIEYGGTVVDFDGVPAAIEAADADVVALQEAYGHTCRVAEAVGWEYCDRRTQTISRFPLVAPDDELSPAVLVAVSPGQVFGVVNIHLPSAPYGPNRAAAGASAEELVAGEKGRLRAIADPMSATVQLQDDGIPVVLTGDFNTPSHLDWTEETEGLRDHVIPVEWPVTVEIDAYGLTDAYRAVFPDPVEHAGLTWPASRPKAGSYNPGLAGKPADRIDMTFVSDGVEVQSAEIVGEEASPVTDIAVDPWPSDHRGVVFELEIETADPGPYVAPAQRLVDVGEAVRVLVYASPMPAELEATAEGATLSADVGEGGLVDLPTEVFGPGPVDLRIVDESGESMATATLWVQDPGTTPEITTSEASYRRGEPIPVSWENAPGNKWDWIGVYRSGADPNVAWYKNWDYTDAQIAGSLLIGGETPGGPWPLPPGRYDVVLLEDDSYEELARAPFVVRR